MGDGDGKGTNVESPTRRLFFFGEGTSEGDPTRKDLLGGKGASLAAMSRAGLPVPPGFTISVDCCREYLEQAEKTPAAGGERSRVAGWPEGLETEVRRYLARLEEVTGRKFGEGAEPLLVSVRSGAAVSMPGMMDTILNCGLHPGLGELLPDRAGFERVYAQFAALFVKTVTEASEEETTAAEKEAGDGPDRDRKLAAAYRALYEKKTGRPFPDTPWDVLADCINAVFDSWNNERAVVYRKHNDIRGLHGTAVTVQSMFPSERSGIGFTVNPTAPEAEELVIESSYGLGEAVVSGAVTPDHFVLDRKTLRLKETVVGDKTQMVTALGGSLDVPDPKALSLTEEQVGELARLALKIEDYFGMPVDFEWGWANGRFGLLQSRAVRGLDIAKDVEVGRREEVERLRQLAGEHRKVWVVHNLSETLEAPTPLTWDVIRGFMSGNGGFGLMYRDFGYRPSAKVREEGFLELICGRIYADPERTAELFWEGMPLEYDLDEIVKDPGMLEAAPTKFAAEKADGSFFLRLPGTILAMFRSFRLMKKTRAKAREDFEAVLRPFLEYVKEKREQDLAALPTAEVLAELRRRRVRVLDEFGKESLKPGFFGGLARAALEQSLAQLLGPQRAAVLCNTLTSGLEGDSTVEQNTALYRLARGEGSLEDFLEKYGHRAVGEMELAESRWREDPSYLEGLLNAYRGGAGRSPEELHAANKERRVRAERELPALLVEWGGSSQREDFEILIKEAQTLLPYREVGKHYLMMGYELIRKAITELARRWDLGREVFFLKLDELARFESARPKLMEKIATRKVRWESARRLEHPRVVDSKELEKLGRPVEYEAATELKADPLAAGVAEGTARLVFDPAKAGDLGPNPILVCSSTDPGWTALFVNIKGLVVERGGALSHGAITARDFGIPAVACQDATKRIKEGARVRVDGNRGLVTLPDAEGN